MNAKLSIAASATKNELNKSVQQFAKNNVKRTEQFKVRVAEEDRISGRLYDYHSGACIGLASDEQKAMYPPNTVFSLQISGCPHKLMIHP